MVLKLRTRDAELATRVNKAFVKLGYINNYLVR
jgi:hypothetical protein